MTTHSPSLTRLVNTAPDWVEDLEWLDARSLRCVAWLNDSDGERIDYGLRITAGSTVVVREARPNRIPAWCPERHLYRDGSFCLGFKDVPIPDSDENAVRWWRLVGGFLDQQRLASHMGRWPDPNAWPHGDEAARIQVQIDGLNRELAHPGIQRDLKSGKLRLRRGSQTQLTRSGRACPCGSGRTLNHCHGPLLRRLFQAQIALANANTAFWAGCHRRTCCQTVDACPLNPRSPLKSP